MGVSYKSAIQPIDEQTSRMIVSFQVGGADLHA